MPSVSDGESPLDSHQRAFNLLIRRPAPIAFDGRGFSGCPQRIMALDELKTFLLDHDTTPEVRDSVWRELVVRARRDGAGWGIGAIGIAMPGLRKRAGDITRGYRGDTDDIDAEMLKTFWEQMLQRADLDQHRILGRMLDAAERAGRKIRYPTVTTDPFDSEPAGPRLPLHPWDHPEFVLARAIVIGVIDADDANLIAETRLEGVSVQTAAARRGIQGQLASHWRDQAEQRLVAAIRSGDLAGVRLRPRPAKSAQRTVLMSWPGEQSPPLCGQRVEELRDIQRLSVA
ncbi:hypothetical protein [Polymorphospora sp. NPDC050346]|uniref:hypothetical protein n=1 Tax=Polymorphospora sp. NPDC050346 TaxID=3155780 RepID=UPI0033E2E4D3